MLETDKNSEIFKIVSQVKSHDGKLSLLEHIMKLYETKVEMNEDGKFLDLIEDISIKIKKDGNYYNDETNRESLINYLQEFVKNCQGKKNLLGPLVKKLDGGEVEVISQVSFVPEYHNIFKTLEWVGLSIGEKESYLLTNSLRNLVNNKGIAGGILFWGKIYGREKDYYIAEASGIEANAENPITDPDYEKRNEDGVNKNTYFVTNDLTGDWIELPDVKPSQMRAARKIRYIFTGDLNRKIFTNPHFPGEEKELLRCQIARIYHGTKIEPSINHWIVSDAENPYKPLEKSTDDKVKPMKLNEYLSLSNWIHMPPNILKQGRVSHFIDPTIEDQEAAKEKEKKIDPLGQRIKPISEDTSLPSSIPNVKLPSWRLQYMYEDKYFINPGIKQPESQDEEARDNTVNYTLVCLKSLRWPGSYTIKFKNDFYYFYFGWGQKFADYTMGEKFVYQDFPSIPKDIEDYQDFPEPNSPPHEENNQIDENKKPAADDD